MCLNRIVAIALSAGMLIVMLAQAEDSVTEWTIAADRLGGGGANWQAYNRYK